MNDVYFSVTTLVSLSHVIYDNNLIDENKYTNFDHILFQNIYYNFSAAIELLNIYFLYNIYFV